MEWGQGKMSGGVKFLVQLSRQEGDASQQGGGVQI